VQTEAEDRRPQRKSTRAGDVDGGECYCSHCIFKTWHFFVE